DSAGLVPAGQLLPRGFTGFRIAALNEGALTVTDEEGKPVASVPPQIDMDSRRRQAVHFADDGSWCVADIADDDGGVIRLRDSTGRERLLRLPAGHQGLFKLHFSPDGLRVAALQRDSSISICDVAACRETAHCDGDNRAFHAMAFSADGRRVAMAA